MSTAEKTKKPKPVSIQKELITNSIHLREGLDKDRLELLLDWITGDGKLDPILVSRKEDGTYTVIDGNHRFHLLTKMNNEPCIDCIVYDGLTNVQEYAIGIQANFGHPKDLTKKDFHLSMAKCLDQGMTIDDMKSAFSSLNPGMFSKYISSARKALTQRAVRKALDLIAKNPKMSREQAAGYTQCTSDDIKKAIEKKANTFTLIANQKSASTKKFTHLSGHIAAIFQNMHRAYNEGLLTTDQMRDYSSYVILKVEHLKELVLDWQKRTIELIGPQKEGMPISSSFTEETTPAGYVMKPK